MVAVGVGAGVWAATGSPLAIPVAIGTGVLIDADHVLDFLDWFVSGDKRRMYVLFHAWEVSILGLLSLLFLGHPLFVAAVLGYTGHLVADSLANRTHPLAYFMLYRLYRGFDRRYLTLNPDAMSLMLHRHDVPLWARIEPWLYRLVYRARARQR